MIIILVIIRCVSVLSIKYIGKKLTTMLVNAAAQRIFIIARVN